METIIQIIHMISDNRFWIGPILVVVLLAMLVIVFGEIFKAMSEEIDG
ncbi:MAG: hypothetical protein JRD05_00605 [Deltaproteobacteria bacterium]|nr:hypothetical protein [Deltaproteobacteria bacterium]